jgi:lysophospholipase L1-like esterase
MQLEQERLSSAAKWGILIGLTLATVVLLFGIAEAALRVRQTLKYGWSGTVESMYRLDERIGLRVPIASLNLGRLSTNSLGFRGPEIAQPKPDRTIRLAFLGASTTWCAEVGGNDQVWPHLVAQHLQRTYPQSKVDYVNAGVPGYTVASSTRNLQHRVSSLSPDVIVIYHATNNLSGELRELAAHTGLTTDAKVQTQFWLGEYSLLWYLAEKNLRIWMAQQKATANIDRLEVDPATLGDEFRRDLTILVRDAQRHAKVVAIATFSTQLREHQTPEQQLDASASALYYAPFVTPSTLIKSYRRYNDIIREVAKATGATLIEGEDDIPGDRAHFNDTVHFTTLGSRAMATRVGNVLAGDPGTGALFLRDVK